MTPPNMGGEYNPLTGETDPPHYPDLPGGPHDLNRDFTSPLHQQGSPGSLVIGKYRDSGSGATGELFIIPS